MTDSNAEPKVHIHIDRDPGKSTIAVELNGVTQQLKRVERLVIDAEAGKPARVVVEMLVDHGYDESIILGDDTAAAFLQAENRRALPFLSAREISHLRALSELMEDVEKQNTACAVIASEQCCAWNIGLRKILKELDDREAENPF